MSTEAVAKRLVELCRAGEFEKAQLELYADDAVSLEPDNLPPGAPGNVKGLEAIRRKSGEFWANIETLHAVRCSDPVIAGNWFSVALILEVTMKGMGRIGMEEICVYRVRDDKVVHEQFFYDVGHA